MLATYSFVPNRREGVCGYVCVRVWGEGGGGGGGSNYKFGGKNPQFHLIIMRE